MLDFNIQRILLTVPGILIGLAFHEFAHGFMSDRLGDPTPRSQGRLTLSPIPHIDILGFILIVLVGFGWAKPVQINTRYYKKPKRDEILVSIAGPVMNLVVAFVFAVFVKIWFYSGIAYQLDGNLSNIVVSILFYAMYINVVLALFNMIPLPPLDGFHVLANIIPARNYRILYTLEQYSSIILILIIITPVVSYIIMQPLRLILGGMITLLGIPPIFGF